MAAHAAVVGPGQAWSGPRGSRTCETDVHVREIAARTCTATTPHVVVRFSVASRPPGRLRRGGTGGRDRSDPLFSMPAVASAEVGMCTSIPPFAGGRSGSISPCRKAVKCRTVKTDSGPGQSLSATGSGATGRSLALRQSAKAAARFAETEGLTDTETRPLGGQPGVPGLHRPLGLPDPGVPPVPRADEGQGRAPGPLLAGDLLPTAAASCPTTTSTRGRADGSTRSPTCGSTGPSGSGLTTASHGERPLHGPLAPHPLPTGRAEARGCGRTGPGARPRVQRRRSRSSAALWGTTPSGGTVWGTTPCDRPL